MPKKMLDDALAGVIEDAVSLVGVDLNACSVPLLRHVAGMGPTRAKAVVDYREKNGAFVNRSQLRKVKGIGAKTFEQCAGFVRISQASVPLPPPPPPPPSPPRLIKDDDDDDDDDDDFVPQRAAGKSRKRKAGAAAKVSTESKRRKKNDDLPEPFDATNIHPESYEAARK